MHVRSTPASTLSIAINLAGTASGRPNATRPASSCSTRVREPSPATSTPASFSRNVVDICSATSTVPANDRGTC